MTSPDLTRKEQQPYPKELQTTSRSTSLTINPICTASSSQYDSRRVGKKRRWVDRYPGYDFFAQLASPAGAEMLGFKALNY